MKRVGWKAIVAASLIALVVACSATVLYWQGTTRGPSQDALDALQTTGQVKVTVEPGLITFEPVGGTASTGLIFYPGGGIDVRSYAPVLHQIAARGFTVAVPSMPLNLAFLQVNAADEVIARFPDIERWAIAGHSLGGVAAARYAAAHPAVAGLAFWASYPGDGSLREASLPILSIYGSRDGLTTPQDVDSSRRLLPQSTAFIEIDGGNHAQFGSYGPQSGDNDATLPPETQWAEIANATVDFLEKISR